MRSWLASFVWRLHYWDVALSYRIALRTDEDKRRSLPYWVALFCAHLGDSWLWVIIAGFCFKQAYIHRSEDEGRRIKQIATWVISVISATIVTLLVKRQVRRTRPGKGNLLYGSGADVHSFPSGHAVRLAAIAMWSEALVPGRGWLAWPLLLLVGWSRIALGIHYVGDVVAGIVLGSVVGILFRRIGRDDKMTR
jgi:undecaprenyl-diphosphatase